MPNPVQTLKALSEHSQDVEQAHAAVRAEILQSIEESKRLLSCLRDCLIAVEGHFAGHTKFRVNLAPAHFGKDEMADKLYVMQAGHVLTRTQCTPHSGPEFLIHETNYLDAMSFLASWGLTLVPSSTRVSYFSVGAAE